MNTDGQIQATGGGSADPQVLLRALIRADRSETLGKLAAGLGRELGDLLMAIQGGIETSADPSQEPLRGAARACERATEIARKLVALNRGGGEGLRETIDPRTLLRQAASEAGAGCPAAIEVSVADDTPAIKGDRAQVLQAFHNLILNALDALHPPPRDPTVQLRAAPTRLEEGRIEGLPPGDYVEFEVRDNGRGMAPSDLERIWEPYFTTKKHGAGLGLPAALAIVREHGGQIGVDSTLGVGSVFTVFLPASAPATSSPVRNAATARFKTGRILVVDSERESASLVSALLARLNYTSDTASDTEEALRWYRRYFDVGRPYDAVLIALGRSRDSGGTLTLEALRTFDPEARAVALYSGDPEQVAADLPESFAGSLAKPFGSAELGRLLATLLG